MSFSIVDEERPPARPKRTYTAPVPDGPTPEYQVVTNITDGSRPRKRVRKDWRPVLDELLAGNLLFMSLEDLSDQDVKYLTLAVRRLRDDRLTVGRLRTQRETRDEVAGRLLWIELD